MSSIFRQEVLEAKKISWVGDATLAHPVRLRTLTLFVALLAVLMVLFLFFGEYTWRATAEGQLFPEAGVVGIFAPTAGVVVELPSDGLDYIEKGEAVAVISTSRVTAQGRDEGDRVRQSLKERESSAKAVAQATIERLDSELKKYKSEMASAAEEIAQIRRLMAIRREQVRLAEENLNRFESIAQKRYISAIQLNEQKQNLLNINAGIEALAREKNAAQRELARLEAQVEQIQPQRASALAALAQEVASLDQEGVQQESAAGIRIIAPVSGRIANHFFKVGQSVGAGNPVIEILPDGSSLQAHLLVPSRSIGFIDVGDKVKVRLHAFPFQKFGSVSGRVAHISSSAVRQSNETGQEPTYKVTVELDSQSIMVHGIEEHFLPGMTVEADIMGDRRTLVEWLFEPVLGMKDRL